MSEECAHYTDWARLRGEGVGWVRGRGVKVWVWLVVHMWMMEGELSSCRWRWPWRDSGMFGAG